MKTFFLLTALSASVYGFAQKADARLHFTKGQKLEVTTETTKTTNTELMGQSTEGTANSVLTELYSIEDASEKGASILHEIKRLTFSSRTMGNKQDFDSENEADRRDVIGQILNKSLTDRYKMSIDAYGKIIDITSAVENVADKDNNAEAHGMAGIVAFQLGFSLIRPTNGTPSIFKIIPDKGVSQGDTWTDSSSANGQTKTTVYKVNSITAAEILLDYTEEVHTSTTEQIMGQDVGVKSEDKITGQIILDKSTGLYKKKTAFIDTNASMEQQGMSLPYTGKTTVTITVKSL